MRKLGYYKQININRTSKYVPKKYNTPKQIGIKWQIDVKFVPIVCQSEKIPCDKRFYQYTCIDEASRERFLLLYKVSFLSNACQDSIGASSNGVPFRAIEIVIPLDSQTALY